MVLLVLALVLLAPVVIGMFLLAMEWLEFRLLDTVPTPEFDHALLAPRAAGRAASRPEGRARPVADPSLAEALGALGGEVAGPSAEPTKATG